MVKWWVALAGLNGFIGVASGAYGFHGLAEKVSDTQHITAFQLGAQFQLIHAVVLIGVGWMASRAMPMANLAGCAFCLGIVLFTGSLYALPFTSSSLVIMATPLGGLSFMIGWALIMLSGLRDHHS